MYKIISWEDFYMDNNSYVSEIHIARESEFFKYNIRVIDTQKGIEELERQLKIIKSEIKPEF